MGDGRTYEHVLALRAVQTQDFMTADWAHLPHELLGRVSNRIINEVRGMNRVVYDISGKPPATIEWGRFDIRCAANIKVFLNNQLGSVQANCSSIFPARRRTGPTKIFTS